MPYGQHGTDQSSRDARRARSPARDASIDEILKSIQQIIDEEPLTMRGDAPARSDRAARGTVVDKPARLRSFEAAPSQPVPRKRPARVLRPAAEDDVLAELLAPPPEDLVAQSADTVAPVVETPPAVVVAVETAGQAEPSPIAIANEPVPADEPSAIALSAEPDAPLETVAVLVESAPVEADLQPVSPRAVEAAMPETHVEAAPAEEPEPVQAPAVEAKQQDEPAPISAADALLQSLAAGLGATGFEIAAPPPVETPAPSVALVVNAEDTQLQPAVPAALSGVTALTPAQAAAAAVAEVAAANTVPPSPEPVVVVRVEASAAADGDGIVETVVAAAEIETAAPVAALPPVLAEGLEDGIATMLRPLLREWLDAHLPRMVEKALKEELRERPLTARPFPTA